MTAQAKPSLAETVPQEARTLSRHDRLKVLGAYLTTWCETCTDYGKAAALFEQLSTLSDAELYRRGFSRATLGREVCAACDRTGTLARASNEPPNHRRDECEKSNLALYLRGWAQADPALIVKATAEGYDFYDPFVGHFSRRTLAQYFVLLRARLSVGRIIRWPELGFNLRGPMQSKTWGFDYRYWREAPLLGLTGASSIVMTHEGVIAETVAYDLNVACDWLRG
jgi:hypothetical protein